MKPISQDAFGKLPPHSIEAEMCAIASMMLDAKIAAQILTIVTRGDFYLTDHVIMFDVLAELTRAGRKVDAVILRDELKRRDQLDAIGGSAYIATVLGTVPSAAHGEEYASTVKRTATRRHAIGLCDDVIRRMFAGQQEADEVLADAMRELLKLQADGGESRFVSIGDAIDEMTADLRDQTKTVSIRTGIADFDKMFGGLPVGLTIVGAHPSMGKSLLAKDIARRVAAGGHDRPSRRVGMISVEELRRKIAENAAAAASGVDNRLIHQNQLSTFDREYVIDAVSAWRGLPITIVDDAQRLSDILTVMTTLRVRERCDLIIIDHAHLIDGEVGRDTNKTAEVTKISTAIKNHGKQLGVATMLLAQLRKSGEQNVEKPRMADLRESGTLAQDADLICLLYREDYHHKGDPNWQKTNVLEVIVDKNRNGPTGVCPLPINLAAQRIEDEPNAARARIDTNDELPFDMK